MNRELFALDLQGDKRLTSAKILEEVLTLDFEGDAIVLTGTHDQDCCENVYAAWSAIKPYLPQLVGKYNKLVIKGVSGEGFLLCFEGNYSTSLQKVFIPCYNEQNGYYSDHLDLIVSASGVEHKVSASDYVEERIY